MSKYIYSDTLKYSVVYNNLNRVFYYNFKKFKTKFETMEAKAPPTDQELVDLARPVVLKSNAKTAALGAE